MCKHCSNLAVAQCRYCRCPLCGYCEGATHVGMPDGCSKRLIANQYVHGVDWTFDPEPSHKDVLQTARLIWAFAGMRGEPEPWPRNSWLAPDFVLTY